jgi:hypothetical protein
MQAGVFPFFATLSGLREKLAPVQAENEQARLVNASPAIDHGG